MVKIKPFPAIRPSSYNVDHVASVFYDVPSIEEVVETIEENPKSFLNIERAEVGLPEELQEERSEIIKESKRNFDRFLAEGWLIKDDKPAYYLYRLNCNDESQYGIVMTIAVEEYLKGNILLKENSSKDPAPMVDLMSSNQAQTSAVLLSISDNENLTEILEDIRRGKFPSYSFDYSNDTNHCVWIVDEPNSIERLTNVFAEEIMQFKLISGAHLLEAAAEVAAKTGQDTFMAFVYPGVSELICWPLSGLFIQDLEPETVEVS